MFEEDMNLKCICLAWKYIHLIMYYYVFCLHLFDLVYLVGFASWQNFFWESQTTNLATGVWEIEEISDFVTTNWPPVETDLNEEKPEPKIHALCESFSNLHEQFRNFNKSNLTEGITYINFPIISWNSWFTVMRQFSEISSLNKVGKIACELFSVWDCCGRFLILQTGYSFFLSFFQLLLHYQLPVAIFNNLFLSSNWSWRTYLKNNY